MIDKAVIQDLLDQKINETGEKFFIVDLNVNGANKITVELDHEENPVSIEDCIQFSRQIEGNLDREEQDFELEVASAGLSNPFKVHKQYIKNIGRTVKLLLKTGKTVEGELKKVTEDAINIEYTKREKVEGKKKKVDVTVNEEYSFNDINQTKLVITFK